MGICRFILVKAASFRDENWRFWSGLRDLNPRSPGPKPGAIPNFAKPGYSVEDFAVVVKYVVKEILPHFRETFKSGEIAYMLNHGNEDNPVWFQTLGTDETPVLASSHEIVILKEDGTYANKQGSAIDKLEMEQRLPAVVNVYGIDGRLVRTGVARADALRGLPAGIYVIGGRKVANR